jgi:hypothetical protein
LPDLGIIVIECKCTVVSTRRTFVAAVVSEVTVSGENPCIKPGGLTVQPFRLAHPHTTTTSFAVLGVQVHNRDTLIANDQFFECLLSYRNAAREAREFQFHPQRASVEFALSDTKTKTLQKRCFCADYHDGTTRYRCRQSIIIYVTVAVTLLDCLRECCVDRSAHLV